MRELLHEPNHHRLLEDETGKLHLEVECGTTAVFLVTFALNDAERKVYASGGPASILDLAWKVRDSPGDYTNRAETS